MSHIMLRPHHSAFSSGRNCCSGQHLPEVAVPLRGELPAASRTHQQQFTSSCARQPITPQAVHGNKSPQVVHGNQSPQVVHGNQSTKVVHGNQGNSPLDPPTHSPPCQSDPPYPREQPPSPNQGNNPPLIPPQALSSQSS